MMNDELETQDMPIVVIDDEPEEEIENEPATLTQAFQDVQWAAEYLTVALERVQLLMRHRSK